MTEQHTPTFKLTPVQPFELKFHEVSVVATVQEKTNGPKGISAMQKVQKTILNKVSGIFSPNTFTAIVGPSGCGKTTMLNLLSGRLLSENLELDGSLQVNSKPTNDIGQYEAMIGYIMQEDLLMATFTPKESFRFVADLRLINASEEEKAERVSELINILGLSKCENTYVGNNMIRGVSGGEKRRTSIGVELLTNPSIVFLDEPTTGLDSTTALHLMQFLNTIAKAGRTIISTIHQPSSEIFNQFDRLLIMVQGNIVYQGQSKDSMRYFGDIGFPVKKQSNPTDYYMKIMNKEGLSLEYIERGEEIDDDLIKAQFEERVAFFKSEYAKVLPDFNSTITTEISSNGSQGNLPFLGQCYYVCKRAIKNELRNPMDVALRLAQFIIQGAFCAVLYYKASDTTYASLQNVTGCLTFILMTVAFGAVSSNIATFNSERSIFIRERMNNSYSSISYYMGRSVAYLPLDLILPLLFLGISYFSSHLNNNAGVFFMQLLALELVYWMSASYGLLISTAIKDFAIALALIPILVIPMMLVSGFFVSLNQVPKFFYWLEYLSMFKYGYQAMVTNQYNHPIDCGDGVYCDILETKFKFPEVNWVNYFLLFIIGLIFRVIAYYMLDWISNPKTVKIGKDNKQVQMRPVAVPTVPTSNQLLQIPTINKLPDIQQPSQSNSLPHSNQGHQVQRVEHLEEQGHYSFSTPDGIEMQSANLPQVNEAINDEIHYPSTSSFSNSKPKEVPYSHTSKDMVSGPSQIPIVNDSLSHLRE